MLNRILFALWCSLVPLHSWAGTEFDGSWGINFSCPYWPSGLTAYAQFFIENGELRSDGSTVAASSAYKVRGTVTSGGDLKVRVDYEDPPQSIVFSGKIADTKISGHGTCTASLGRSVERGSTQLTGHLLVPAARSQAAVAAEKLKGEQRERLAVAPAGAELCNDDHEPAAISAASGGDDRAALRVLAIGVSKYRSAEMNLGFAAKDACDVALMLGRKGGKLYRAIEVRTLLDKKATREAILDNLERLARETTSRDVVMLFVAGHGVNDASGEYFFLPHDADLGRLARTSVSQAEFRRALMAIPGKVFVMFDTCHSGQIMSSRRSIPPDIARFVKEIAAADSGLSVFTAATGRQFAIESEEWGNGAFTKALLEAARGLADYNRDGALSVFEMELYVSSRVKELTKNQQAPTVARPAASRNIPLLLVR